MYRVFLVFVSVPPLCLLCATLCNLIYKGKTRLSRVIVFDVNETMLDLRALEPQFQRVFGDSSVMNSWFAQVLQSAMVASMTGAYTDFGTIGSHALEITAARADVELAENDRHKILRGMLNLPPIRKYLTVSNVCARPACGWQL